MVKLREAIVAALRGDPDLVPKVTESLRERIDEEQGPMQTVVQAAEALAPIIEDAVRKRPSKLGKVGLKSAHLLARLAAIDERSNKRLVRIAKGSTVGIVFVDIAGFTTFTATHGDEEATALVDKLEEVVERAVKTAKGECVKRLGDGFLLAFPSASQAVRGAVALNAAVERLRSRDETFDAQLRIAAHVGDPVIQRDDLVGHDVNLTARLLDYCKPGQILVSDDVKTRAERRLKSLEWHKVRTVKPRGLEQKVTLYSVTAQKAHTK